MEEKNDFKILTDEELLKLENMLNAIDNENKFFSEAKEQIQKVKRKENLNQSTTEDLFLE